jgi:hypothetical protein
LQDLSLLLVAGDGDVVLGLKKEHIQLMDSQRELLPTAKSATKASSSVLIISAVGKFS